MSLSRRRRWKLLLPIAAIEVGLLAAVLVTTVHFGANLAERNRWVAHTHQVSERLENTMFHLQRSDAARRDYLLTGDTNYLQTAAREYRSAQDSVDAVRALTSDNPFQRRQIAELLDLLKRKTANMQRDAFAPPDEVVLTPEQRRQARTLIETTADIDNVLTRMQTEESRLLVLRNGSMENAVHSGLVRVFVCLISVMSLLALTTFLIGYTFTQRERAEETLRRSQALLMEAQRVARLGSWEVDTETGEITWSRELFRLMVRDVETGEPSLSEWAACYCAADASRQRAAFEKAAAEGLPFDFDARLCEAGVSSRWVQTVGQAERDAEGKIVRLFGIVMDIHDRKAAEDKIQDYSVVLEMQMAELARANAELEALATTDSLSGLRNSRAFHDRLIEEVNCATDSAMPLSLILIDIDKFKNYNDTFGHPEGDLVLRRVAELIQANAPDRDLAARCGGEEFAVILPQTTGIEAMATAERIRRDIDSAPWLLRRVTASFGVASLCAEMDSAGLISSADQALYQAKAGGRNCVARYTPLLDRA